MHCHDVACSQCQNEAVEQMFGKAFFEPNAAPIDPLLDMLQQAHPDSQSVTALIKAQPMQVIQPHHFCALKRHKHLAHLLTDFIQNILEAKMLKLSSVRYLSLIHI